MSILTDYGTMHFGAQDAWDVVQDKREYLMNHEYSDGEVQTKISDGYYFLYKSIKQTGWKLVYNVKEKQHFQCALYCSRCNGAGSDSGGSISGDHWNFIQCGQLFTSGTGQ